MVAISSLLVVVLISLLVTRVATIALIATGLSREMARFPARSGTGFATSEAEAVVGQAVRRRTVLVLMLAGNAGNAGLAAVVADTLVLYGLEEPSASSTSGNVDRPARRHTPALSRCVRKRPDLRRPERA